MNALLSFIQKLLIGLFALGFGLLVLVGLFRCQREEGGDKEAWKQAKAQDSIEGYLNYLRDCQSCPHEEDAENALDQLQREQGLVARLERKHLPVRAGIASPVFSPDGREILGVVGTQLYFWNSTTGQRVVRAKGGFQAMGRRSFEAVAYSPDARAIAAGMSDAERGYLVLLDSKTGEVLSEHAVEWYDVKAVAFSPEGGSVGWITHGPTGIWEPSTGKILRATHEGANSLAFVRRDDGKALLVTASGRDVWFWDAASMEIVKQSQLNTERPLLGLSRDGLLVGFHEGSVLELWDTRLGTPIATLPDHDGEITGFCRDERKGWIAVGTKSGNLYLWNLADAQKLGSIHAHNGPIVQIACSKQGRVITNSWDATKVWDLEKLRFSTQE